MLMKVTSKRRRTKIQIEEEKVEQMMKKQAIEDKLANFERI
jgi:hypothetical protein